MYLFTYTERVKDAAGKVSTNVNHLNPMAFVSGYWEVTADGRNQYNAFTTATVHGGATKRYLFPEKTGAKFLQLVEWVLQQQLDRPDSAPAQTPAHGNNRPIHREHNRPRTTSEILDEPEETSGFVPDEV